MRECHQKMPFAASAETMSLGDMRLMRTVSTPHEAACNAAARPASQPGQVELVIQREGRSRVGLADTEIRLGPGDWSLNIRPEAFRLCHDTSTEQLMIVLPWAELQQEARGLPALSRQSLSGESGAGRLMCDFAVATFQRMPELTMATAPLVRGALVQLIRATLRELAGTRPETGKRRLADDILQLVARRLADPSLSIASIARAVRVSKRYVHLAFQEAQTGLSLAEFILQERLTACEQELAAGPGRPISAIAESWGFTDPGYFSRVFRRRYGMAPSRYRAGD